MINNNISKAENTDKLQYSKIKQTINDKFQMTNGLIIDYFYYLGFGFYLTFDI